jgi:hypothetical protein
MWLDPRLKLRFRFICDERERKQLAKLKRNEQVTIEGECRPQNDESSVLFINCKLIAPRPTTEGDR